MQVMNMGVDAMVPPHDLDAEAAVLSASMLDQAALDKAAERLRPEHFYAEAHRRIFEAALSLLERGQPVDVMQIASTLKRTNRLAQIGGGAYLTEILNAAPAIANIEPYAKTVFELWRMRQVIAVCQRVVAEGYAGGCEADDFVDRAEQAIFDVAAEGGKRASTETLRDASRRGFAKLADHIKRGATITGISTGFRVLDGATGGLHDGELTIVAGRPAMGKTSLVMNIASNVASAGHGVLVFSLEMPNEQLAIRAMCSEGEVDLRRARTGAFSQGDWERLIAATKRLCVHEHFYLDESSDITPLGMRAKVRTTISTLARNGKRLGLVAVDYLQLMRGRGGNESREQAVSEISRGLKALAKELGVPVVALSQLNRGVESRTDKRPMLSDLRESGSLEQDADAVVMIYRDDYYNASSKEPGVAELIIAKQRNGPTGTVRVGFRASTTTFFDLAEDDDRAVA